METRYYKRNDERKSYPYEDGRLLATIYIENKDRWIANPQESDFLTDGWEQYTPPTPPPYEPTRSEKIHAEIREKYSENTELQILRENAAGKEGAAERFAEYNAYVESILAKYPED